jgi:hypothetical protein
MPLPVVYVTPDETFTGAITHPTPPGTLSGGLGAFLRRLGAGLTTPGAAIVVDAGAMAALGLPAQLPRDDRRGSSRALDDARAAGWTVGTLGPWSTFHRWEGEGSRRYSRALHLGCLPWLNPSNCALWSDDPRVMTATLARFSAMVGVPYHGAHGGLAGLSLMRGMRRTRDPRWRPNNWRKIPPAEHPVEKATIWEQVPGAGGTRQPRVYGYDVRRQYLASALLATYAADELRHTGVVEPARYNRPGYYKVEAPHWAYQDRCPPPMVAAAAGTVRWITGATLDYLYQLDTEYGVLSCPVVLDSWTGPPSRVLRSWAEALSTTLDACEGRSGESPQMIGAIKGCYRAGIGLMYRPTSRVHRPDWADTIVGLARCNLHRRIWTEGKTTGRWPVKVTADTAWYQTAAADALTGWPHTFPRDVFRPVDRPPLLASTG